MNKPERRYTFECWPRFADPRDPSSGGQYDGWPVTVHQRDNDGRTPTGSMPEIVVNGLDDAVVRITDETSGLVVRVFRISGDRWRPPVFGDGPYTLEIGCPDRGVWRRVESVTPTGGNPSPIIVDFEP